MSPTLKDLLPPDQQPLTVQSHETVLEAIDRLRAHDYNQLPVVDGQGCCHGEVVTFDTIAQAVLSMDAKPSELRVKDAIKQVDTYSADDDLLTTLHAIQRSDFALIVGEGDKLTGIVTTADTTSYFHRYAGDLMIIEGIEESVKGAIEILYGGLQTQELTDAIEAVTDRASDTRKKLPGAIKTYLVKLGIPLPTGDDKEALALAESKLNLPKAGKAFDRLTFDEYTEILLRHPKAPTAGDTNSVDGVRKMLNKVRDTRNKLAHFRGDVSIAERAHIKFADNWLERQQPVRPTVVTPIAQSVDAEVFVEAVPPSGSTNPGLAEPTYENKGEEDTAPQGKYAALSQHLAAQQDTAQSCLMSFADIERLLGEKLPDSAYQYRAWWANDPSKPHAAGWLAQGWKAQSLSMSEKRLTFVRTDDRQRAYIAFFSRLNTLMEAQEGFPHRNIGPQGQNWHILASLQSGSAQIANIICAFVRHGKFRVELYLDDSAPEASKTRFDQLFARRVEFEQQFGEPLAWERLEGRRASRIAIYTNASVLSDSENEEVLAWAVKRAVDFFRVFGPEFAVQPDPDA